MAPSCSVRRKLSPQHKLFQTPTFIALYFYSPLLLYQSKALSPARFFPDSSSPQHGVASAPPQQQDRSTRARIVAASSLHRRTVFDVSWRHRLIVLSIGTGLLQHRRNCVRIINLPRWVHQSSMDRTSPSTDKRSPFGLDILSMVVTFSRFKLDKSLLNAAAP